MYTLTIEYEVKLIGNTQWTFLFDEYNRAIDGFISQVKAFMEWKKKICIRLVNDKELIAEYKIS